MKVGVDTFTIRELKLNPIQQLDFMKEHEFAGAQFGGLGSFSKTLDIGEIREVRAYADSLDLYDHISVFLPNPYIAGNGDTKSRIERVKGEIEIASECGWRDLHSSLGGPNNRYNKEIPWERQTAATMEVLRALAPVLRDKGCRINLEDHGETTTFELVRIVEEIGPDTVGICLDTANVLVFAEDPVEAARRAAPYTHMTHTKDGIIYFSERGLTRQGRPPGQGCLDWEKILPILAEHSPDLTLSIEDHKWLFEAEIFTPEWHAEQADLSREELAKVVAIAWEWQRKIFSGECPDPAEYEAIPLDDQMMERLLFGRDYLKDLLKRLGLES